MSLRQWFGRKFLLIKRKFKDSAAPHTRTDVFSISQTPELAADSVREQLIIVLIACAIAIMAVPLMYLIPKLYDQAFATTWVVNDYIAATDDIGRAGNMTMVTTTGLPAVTYYDLTNKTAKYAQRESDGTWTVESIETFGATYGFGTVANIKFGMNIDPTDGKPSVAYCKYGSPATASQLRYAHRVGGGAGDCGTSNNWTCLSVGSTNDSCTMRMLALEFHATSSRPTIATAVPAGGNGTVDFYEYNGSTWINTQAVGSTYGIVYDMEDVVLGYTTSTNQPLVIYSADDASKVQMYYSQRQSNWTWTTPIEIDRWAYDGQTRLRNKSMVRDSSGYFYYTYSPYNGGLKYGTLKGSNIVTSTIDSTVSTTWTGIALDSSNNAKVAYYDNTNDDLRYSSYNGSSWSTETASSTGIVGAYASLALSSDSPLIYYQDVTNGNASFISATAFNTAPSAPTTPYSSSTTAQTGATNPTNLATGTPAFSALFQDPDTGNTANKAQIQVTTSSDGFATVTHWDTGSSGNTITSVAIGSRSQDLVFNNFGTAATYAIGIADDGTESTNTSYNWRIRFWDTGGLAGTWSATATFSILDLPLVPSGMTVPLGTTTATPAWTDNSSIEDRVQVVISTDNVLYSHHASTTAASQTSTSTTDLTPNTLYYFKARSWNEAGYSTSYTTATSGYTLANVPTALIASSTAYDRVNTAWGANSNPSATEYYAINVTAGTNSGWLSTRENLFTGLEGAKSYSFQVRARNGGSVPTEYTSVVSTTTLPNTPNSLSLLADGTSVTASWSANGNSSSANYNVENTTTGATSGDTASLSYTFTGLTAGATYSFRVKALNSDSISSSYSDPTTVTMPTAAGGASSQGKIQQQQQASEAAKDTISGSIIIGEGAATGFTSSTQATLSMRYSDNVVYMMVANDPGFDQATWIPAQTIKSWTLVGGTGSRTVYVKFKSAKGTVSDVFADSVILDQTPPTAPTMTVPADGSTLENKNQTYAGYAEVGTAAQIEILLRSDMSVVEKYSAQTDSSGAWSYTSEVPLDPDSYIVRVTAIDRAGNVSASVERAFSLTDSTPPIKPTVEFPVALSMVETSTGKFATKGTGEPRSKIIIVRDNILTYETVVSDRGNWEFNFEVPFGDGRHSLKYFAIDQSKNQSTDVEVLFAVEIKEAAPETVQEEDEQTDDTISQEREPETKKHCLFCCHLNIRIVAVRPVALFRHHQQRQRSQ